MSDRPTPGQVAYEQYCRSRHAGTVLLPWALLTPALREAWEAAAAAVLAQWTAPEPPPRRWTPQPLHATGDETPQEDTP